MSQPPGAQRLSKEAQFQLSKYLGGSGEDPNHFTVILQVCEPVTFHPTVNYKGFLGVT